MRTLLTLTLGLICGLSQAQEGNAPPKKTDKKPVAKLEGIYELVSGQRGDMKIPKDHLKDSTIVFTKDEVIGTDKDKKNLFVSKYKLMATDKMPWKIMMNSTKPSEAEAVGLIKIDKKTGNLTLIYNLPGGKPPTNFKPSENQHLFIMKKQGDRPDYDKK